MVTNSTEYMANYKMELAVTNAFIATGGSMRTVDGKPVVITNNRQPTAIETVFHHRLQLNGNRPNGRIARLLEIRDNIWNIWAISHMEHKKLHFERKEQIEYVTC